VRTRQRHTSVYTLSAVDLFASAMGAFIIIAIILMPDYQKEVRLEGHLKYLDDLARASQTLLDESELGVERLDIALAAARTRQQELEAEEDIIASELETLNARLQASQRQPPPPPLEADIEEELGSNEVTFRFLGLKTDKTRFLLMVDMNRYLAEHHDLMLRSVSRALESLQPGYEFGILAFQQLDSGPRFLNWPAEGQLAVVTPSSRAQALRFMRGLEEQYAGGSPLLDAFEQAFAGPAEAVILLSDGLPNPAFNRGLPARSLAQGITVANDRAVEIHAVTVGDYFKYQGTVAFMESLARANSGGFLALAQ
jgi:hypothetical protein